MSVRDQVCTSVIEEKTAMPAGKSVESSVTVPSITFAHVLQAVAEAEGLSDGVRGNMRSAVERCAALCSQQGIHAAVSVQLIARKLERLTPAKMGFANPNSFSAFQSNLRRALRLAGITVMPGSHRTPLKGTWVQLKERAHVTDPY